MTEQKKQPTVNRQYQPNTNENEQILLAGALFGFAGLDRMQNDFATTCGTA
jgi:hypothetical protein